MTITGQKGAAALKLQEVTLVDVSNDNVVYGTIEEMSGGNYLVTMDRVPDGEFVVMMKGKDTTTSSDFQRQTTTQMSLSYVIVKVLSKSPLILH